MLDFIWWQGAKIVSQEYIENENARLEREQQFWQREIVVKIEYKFCPNLTIIDTPGKAFTGEPPQILGCPSSVFLRKIQVCRQYFHSAML